MPHPDFVVATLELLDSNYTVANTAIDVAPTLINREIDRTYPDGDAVTGRDLANELTVEIRDDGPSYEPAGTEYDHRVTAPVNVRVETASELANGPLPATASAWRSVWLEVRRAVLVDRVYPIGGSGITDVRLTNTSSGASDGQEYYRKDLDFEYHGFESLP